MTRSTTLDKLFRAAADESHIESQSKRIEHLERAILNHKKSVTFGDCKFQGRPVDVELWEALGEPWEVEDETP